MTQPFDHRVPLLALRGRVVLPHAVVALERVEAPATGLFGPAGAPPGADVAGAVAGGAVPLMAVAIGAPPARGETDVGTLCRLVDRSCEPDGLERVVLEGLCRVRLAEVRGERRERTALALPLPEESAPDPRARG